MCHIRQHHPRYPRVQSDMLETGAVDTKWACFVTSQSGVGRLGVERRVLDSSIGQDIHIKQFPTTLRYRPSLWTSLKSVSSIDSCDILCCNPWYKHNRGVPIIFVLRLFHLPQSSLVRGKEARASPSQSRDKGSVYTSKTGLIGGPKHTTLEQNRFQLAWG